MKIIDRNEQRLAERLRNGENGAMRDFYTLYANGLTGVCSRYIVNREDVKDVLQNAIVQILTHISSFEYRGVGSLKAWATQIIVNESLRFLKTIRRHEQILVDSDIIDEPELDDPPISDVPAEIIHQFVSQLPTGYRTVFNLYVFEGKSHCEIARLLDIRENSSATQLYKAKNLLTRMIEEYYGSQES